MADIIPVKPILDQNGVVIGLGEYSSGDTVPVANGGTGASDAATAIANLGAVAQTDFNSHVTARNPHGTTAADVGAAPQTSFDGHINDLNNPHNVTAAQIGAALASDLAAHVADTNNPHSVTAAQIGAALVSDLTAHTSDTSNPHGVTAAQVGAIPATEKGAAGGVATLDSQGKIPTTQIPAAALPQLFVVNNATERLNLTAQEGDECKQLDDGSWWIMDSLGQWQLRTYQGNQGDVVGPASATNRGVSVFDGTTGKLLADSGVVIDVTQNVTGVNSLTMGGSLSVGGNATISGTVNGRNIQNDGTNLDAHLADTGNPHNVTAAQVGNIVAQWNADQLQSVPVDATPPAHHHTILAYDSGLAAWAPRDHVFGLGYTFVDDPTITINTSTILVTKNVLNFTAPATLPRNAYVKFNVSYYWTYRDKKTDFIAEFYLNNVKLGTGHRQEPSDRAGASVALPTNQYHGFARSFITQVAPGGTLAFEVRFGPEIGGKQAAMWELFIDAFVVGLV